MAKPKPFHFEQSLKELETVVNHLEAGTLSLEDSLKTFERGIKLTRDLQQQLAAAEQKISILIGDQDELSLTDFSEKNDND